MTIQPFTAYHPAGNFWIHILARLGEASRFADLEGEEFVIEGVRVRVATPRMLYQVKMDTVLPQDRLDAQVLRERFDLSVTKAYRWGWKLTRSP